MTRYAKIGIRIASIIGTYRNQFAGYVTMSLSKGRLLFLCNLKREKQPADKLRGTEMMQIYGTIF
jgi:hypothetical protein